MTFTPGIELEILARDDWRLESYAELGLGTESTGNLTALVCGVGVNSLWRVPRGSTQLLFGAGLEYEGSHLLDGEFGDTYLVAEAGVELRRLDVFETAGRMGEVGSYVMVRRFLPEIDLVPLLQERFKVDSQLEVGITVGTRQPVPLWRDRKLLRPGVAHRWGDGLSSVRLNLGFPF